MEIYQQALHHFTVALKAIRRQSKACGLIAIATLWILRITLLLHQDGAIFNTDFWHLINIAKGLDLTKATSLVDPFYPIGYPFLLRLSLSVSFDVLTAGLIISWFSAVVSLCCIYRLILIVTSKSHLLAVIGMVWIALTPTFISAATTEGTDLLAVMFQLLALTTLSMYIWRATGVDHQRQMWGVRLAGIFIGLAYLTRYTALIVLLALLVITLFSRSRRLNAVFNLTITFLLTASPQLIASLVATGNPFTNGMVKNIWFGIYGNFDWLYTWFNAPVTINLGEVISMNPQVFLDHWLHEIGSFFSDPSLTLGTLPLVWIAIASGFTLWFSKIRIDLRIRLALVIVPIAVVVSTALAWLAPRFLLLASIVLTVTTLGSIKACGFLLTRYSALRHPARRWSFIAAVALFYALSIIPNAGNLSDYATVRDATLNQQILLSLRNAGMTDPTKVVSNMRLLHASDIISRDRFRLLHRELPALTPPSVLLKYVRDSNISYLIIDYKNGLGDFDQLDQLRADNILGIQAIGSWENGDIVAYTVNH